MKMMMNSAIARMASKIGCDYLFALGLFMVLREMDKSQRTDTKLDERTVYDLGFMSTKMSRILSTELSTKIWDIYRDTMVDIKRDAERDKKRDYRERKRNPSLSPIPPISPVEKERDISPPVLLRNTAPHGAECAENKPVSKRFVKPTVEELEAYALEIDYNLNAQAFLDYYDGNGWMAGKNHMKDWKATVRNWKRRDEERGKDVRAKRSGDSGTVVLTPEEERLIEQIYANNGRDAYM